MESSGPNLRVPRAVASLSGGKWAALRHHTTTRSSLCRKIRYHGCTPPHQVRSSTASGPGTPSPLPHLALGPERGPSGSPVPTANNSHFPSAPPNPLSPPLCPKVDQPRRAGQRRERTRSPAGHRRARGTKGLRSWWLGADRATTASGPRPGAQPTPRLVRSSPGRANSQPGRGSGVSVTSRWIPGNPTPESPAVGATPQLRTSPYTTLAPPPPGRPLPAAAASPPQPRLSYHSCYRYSLGAAAAAAAAAAAVAVAAAGRPASPLRLRPRFWSAGRPARDPASHWPPGLRAVHWAPPCGRAAPVSGPPGCHLGARSRSLYNSREICIFPPPFF